GGDEQTLRIPDAIGNAVYTVRKRQPAVYDLVWRIELHCVVDIHLHASDGSAISSVCQQVKRIAAELSRRASFDAAYHRVGETSGSNRGAVEKDLNRCAGLNHKIGTAITVEVGCVDSAVIGYAD